MIVATCRRCGPVSGTRWRSLRWVGLQLYDWGEVQELRNCPCGTTLAVLRRSEGASFDTLLRRLAFGGRKKRSAYRRLRAAGMLQPDTEDA